MSMLDGVPRDRVTVSGHSLGRVLLALACWAPWPMALALSASNDPLTVAFASNTVTVDDGASIHYLHGGAASQLPTVVFIPGWTWSGEVWLAQMQALAPTRRVVAVDPRSQGDSSKTSEGNTPEHRAGDMRVLLESLGNEPVVLVGWSQGVQDIAAYVDRFGNDRLAGIVFVDSALAAGPDSLDADPEGTRQLLRRIGIYAQYPDEYMAGMLDASVVRKFPPDEKARQARQRRRTPTSTGISMLVTDMLSTDRRAVATKISVPTLVLASAASSELEAQRALAAKIAGARFIAIEDAGHAVFLDQPVQFSQALNDFLGSIPSRPVQMAPIRKR